MPFYYLYRFVVSKTVLVLLTFSFCIGKARSVEVYKAHKHVRTSFRIIYSKLNDGKCEI